MWTLWTQRREKPTASDWCQCKLLWDEESLLLLCSIPLPPHPNSENNLGILGGTWRASVTTLLCGGNWGFSFANKPTSRALIYWEPSEVWSFLEGNNYFCVKQGMKINIITITRINYKCHLSGCLQTVRSFWSGKQRLIVMHLLTETWRLGSSHGCPQPWKCNDVPSYLTRRGLLWFVMLNQRSIVFLTIKMGH